MQHAVSFHHRRTSSGFHEPLLAFNGFPYSSGLQHAEAVQCARTRSKRGAHVFTDEKDMTWVEENSFKKPRLSGNEFQTRSDTQQAMECCDPYTGSVENHRYLHFQEVKQNITTPGLTSYLQNSSYELPMEDATILDESDDRKKFSHAPNLILKDDRPIIIADRKECLRCLTGEGGHLSHILSPTKTGCRSQSSGTGCVYPS